MEGFTAIQEIQYGSAQLENVNIKLVLVVYSKLALDMNELDTKDPDGSQKIHKAKEDSTKKSIQDRNKRLPLLSPVMRRLSSTSSQRLISPIDSDQELIDLEVASVLAEVKSSLFCSDFRDNQHFAMQHKSEKILYLKRPTTVMTNLQRGNVQTTTPLLKNMTIHQMAAQGELVLLETEIAEGGDVNKCDDYGLTALLWACANGQQSTMEYLIKSGADINISGQNGENALLLASANGFTDIVKQLLRFGLDVNYIDETGSTALMYASYKNYPSCVKLLLEYGADITVQNEDKLTAVDLAVGQVQQAIEQHMLSLFEKQTNKLIYMYIMITEV
ncbi:hypothetical protein KUTeg_018110 [Tegillarca granosa]|uniref:Ankyrin repeat family A protein 2 n=1 Tax=Tegillarca granosa TaxID=220873 RepID=A0ABQ9ELQ7_TEGGR|nr:hypothetical protein KUTeg_018110 [Tegillarca granosa]